MEMILDALKFDYVDKSQGKWPNIDNICYIVTFHSPNRQHKWNYTAQYQFLSFGCHLGRHLDFLEMPKDDKVSSTSFLKKKVAAFQICQNILYGIQI